MSKIVKEVLAANQEYAANFGDKGALPLPPGRKFAILTCMDARMDPAKFAGLSEGDAHVTRNAGGRATDDAIRSLIISYKLLGTQEWFVIHHTDCGMQYFHDAEMGELLATSTKTATHDGTRWCDHADGSGSPEGHYIKWHSIADAQAALKADVERIRNHPLVPSHIPIHGYTYDVKTGKLIPLAQG